APPALAPPLSLPVLPTHVLQATFKGASCHDPSPHALALLWPECAVPPDGVLGRSDVRRPPGERAPWPGGRPRRVQALLPGRRPAGRTLGGAVPGLRRAGPAGSGARGRSDVPTRGRRRAAA